MCFLIKCPEVHTRCCNFRGPLFYWSPAFSTAIFIIGLIIPLSILSCERWPNVCWSVGGGICFKGGGPRVVVSTAAFHARVRGSIPGLGGLKETKMFLPHPRVKVSIVGSLRDREVACSASDRQGSNFESCVWRTVSSHSSHHPQEVLLAQFSLYVHKGGLKPDSFHLFVSNCNRCNLDHQGVLNYTYVDTWWVKG